MTEVHPFQHVVNMEAAPKRPLKDLTTLEYHLLFAAAYGYEPGVDKLIVRKMADAFPDQKEATLPISIGDGCFFLTLYGDGQMVAHRQQSGSVFNDLCAGINARKLIFQMDLLDVQFGHKPDNSRMSHLTQAGK